MKDHDDLNQEEDKAQFETAEPKTSHFVISNPFTSGKTEDAKIWFKLSKKL